MKMTEFVTKPDQILTYLFLLQGSIKTMDDEGQEKVLDAVEALSEVLIGMEKSVIYTAIGYILSRCIADFDKGISAPGRVQLQEVIRGYCQEVLERT